MPHQNAVPDKTLVQQITQQLNRTGLGAPCQIVVSVRSGYVTLSGNLQYEIQRRNAVASANRVSGVRSVSDQLQVKAREKKWS